MKNDYYCVNCKKGFEITNEFPKYINGKELCKYCYIKLKRVMINELV